MSVVLELPLQLPPAGSRDVRRRLHEQLKAAILDGRLAPGLQLPASRALAEQLGLSRNTAMAVYDLLLSEGHIVSKPGAGTFVAGGATKSPLGPATRPEAAFNLRPGRPDASAFPFDIWGRLTGRALRQFGRAGGVYREPAGHPALREAIAGHLSFARGLACAAEDVIVTVGAQQAFDLVARTLAGPGKTVVVEDPGYPAAREAFAAAGARVVAAPVDREGLVIEALPEHAALVCLTPSQQYPLGPSLSPARRIALADWASRNDALLVEDDYGGEFRFESPPQPPLRAQDPDGRVVYVGTFSQSLLPALRIGFVVAPARARDALLAARERSDWHGPAIEHATLAAFIAEGHLARHVRRMRRVYAERRTTLLDTLAAHAGGRLEPIPAPAGLHITALLAPSADTHTIVARAAALGVAVDPLETYAAERASPPGLVLGFGQIEAARIDEAVRLLVKAIG
ncbi:PLP-dependent aminotransferase family protein [Caulobacter sp.]|uniref:MocR-like pyridoxine biosynthesis transcription factor PdxR n=1 Tax=Caulobacter sp. TaxID=78 RepID=UPI001B134F38|nr:PLP-dependent aminotransferase family protein [Caulobacter sp.]MBO9545393.1 PLP-dependent aminotransferase family protein [Caulobacter sp.]